MTGKLSMAIVLILASLLIITGCEKREPIGEDKGKVTITYAFFARPHEVTLNKEIVKMFEREHPEIRVVVRTAPYGQFFEKIKIQLAGNTAPDLWLTDGLYLLEWGERGVLKEITQWFNRDLQEKDYYALGATVDSQGRRWGFPQSFQSYALFYNQDLFRTAGLDYPNKDWTWEDLVRAAKVLTKDTDGDGRIDQYGYAGRGIDWLNFIYLNGATALDETKTKSRLNSPRVIEAMEFLHDLVFKYKVMIPYGETTIGDNLTWFRIGKLAMFLGMRGYVDTLNAQAPNLNYDVVLPPRRVTRSYLYVANCLVITAASSPEKQEAAWEFIKFFSSYKIQKLYGEKGHGIPVLKKAAEDVAAEYEKKPGNFRAFLDIMPASVAPDLNKVWRAWVAAAAQKLQLVWLGKKEPKEGCLSAHKAVQRILREAYGDTGK